MAPNSSSDERAENEIPCGHGERVVVACNAFAAMVEERVTL
jgi:hypothetical protein